MNAHVETHPHHARGLTLVEVLVVIAILGVIVCLLLPATRSTRGAARRMSCSNNLKQLGLAFHNYHSAHAQFPMQMGGTFGNAAQSRSTSRRGGDNRYRLSMWVGLTPFMEQQSLWEEIRNGKRFAPMGPAPWSRDFGPWRTEIPTLRCPSDPGTGMPALARTSYAACIGDATDSLDTGSMRWDEQTGCWTNDRHERVSVSGRGAFVPRRAMRIRDIADGLSDTILAGEITTDLGDRDKRTAPSLGHERTRIDDFPLLCRDRLDSERPMFWRSAEQGGPAPPSGTGEMRGFRWADGAPLYTGFNTVLPPNSEICMAGDASGIGMLGSSSRHQGGAHALMADGAVIFITDSIDCGDPDSGTVKLGLEGHREPGSVSPYGLWGALGTRASEESIEEMQNY